MNISLLQKQTIKAIFKDTIRKELRSKTLIVLFVVTSLSMYLMYQVIKTVGGSVDGLPIGIVGNLTFNIMFWGINSLSIIIATILGAGSIRSDFKEKISYTLLTLPVTRDAYFYTRIFGVWVMSVAYYLYSFTLGLLFLTYLQKGVGGIGGYLIALIFSSIVIFVVLNISSFMALYLNQLWSVLSTFVIVILMSVSWGRFSAVNVQEAMSAFNAFDVIRGFFYLFTPHISLYSDLVSALLINDQPMQEFLKVNWLFEIPHLIVSTALLIYVIRLMLKKKDF